MGQTIHTPETVGPLLLASLTAAACAGMPSLSTSPSTSPPQKATAPPGKIVSPRVLSPQEGLAEEKRQRQETASKIQQAKHTVLRVDQKRLPKDQQAMYATVQSFIANAKTALSAQDFVRATNLADKAQVLANDLLQSVQ